MNEWLNIVILRDKNEWLNIVILRYMNEWLNIVILRDKNEWLNIVILRDRNVWQNGTSDGDAFRDENIIQGDRNVLLSNIKWKTDLNIAG